MELDIIQKDYSRFLKIGKHVTIKQKSIFTDSEIDILWKNDKATAQEIIDALGTDALKVFQFHGALTDFVNGIAQLDGSEVTVKYPTNTFTVDPATGKTAVQVLFDDVAPKFKGKNGGYTRVIKTYNRKGDNAPMAIIGLF